MALAAAKKAIHTEPNPMAPWVIREVTFHQALLLDTAQTVQLVLTPTNEQHQFEAFSLLENGQWQRHASGYISTKADPSNSRDRFHDHLDDRFHNYLDDRPPYNLSIEQLRHACPSEVSVEDCYKRLSAQGVTYGNSFRAIQQVYTGEAQALSRLSLPENLLPTLGTYGLHPVLLDACLQSIAAIFVNRPLAETYLPAAIDRVCGHVFCLDEVELWSYVEVTQKDNWLMADIQLMSLAGERLVSLHKLRLQPASKERLLAPWVQQSWVESSVATSAPASGSDSVEDWFYTLDWQPQPLPIETALPTHRDLGWSLGWRAWGGVWGGVWDAAARKRIF